MRYGDPIQVSSGEFQLKIGQYHDEALRRPVIVTKRGRERTVLISVAEYDRMLAQYRESASADDLSAEELADIRTTRKRIAAARNNRG